MRLRFGGLLCGLLAAMQIAKCIYMTHEEMLACKSRPVGHVCGKPVYVNTRWGGHPVCIAQLCRLGHAYKMRAYSCKVNTSFSLLPDSKPNNYLDKHIYTRESEKDELHSGMVTSDGGYSVKFHRTLLQMFGLRKSSGPEYDCLSVECARPGSFIQFLREGCKTQTDSHYVLAALLLLCEGVDVPIELAKEGMIIRQRKGINGVLVDARIGGAALDSGKEQLSEAWQVINFFKQYRDTHKMPSTYEEFQSGDFLESPQLLILTYIGEYVKNAEELMSVMMCALEILDDMGLAESMEDPDSVVSRLFVPASRLPEAQAYLAPFLETFPTLTALERFEEFKRFQSEAEVQNKAEDASDGEEEYFDARGTNCRFIGECFLLLFLAFDSDKKTYSLEGLLSGGKKTEEVEKTRAFFDELQACIEKKCSSLGFPNNRQRERYRDLWLKMNTQFKEALGNAAPTLLNQMRVLAQMTGRPQAVVDELAAHQAAMDTEGSTGLTPEAIESVQALLRSIAVDKRVKVTIKNQLKRVFSERYLLTVEYAEIGELSEQDLSLSFSQNGFSKISLFMPHLSYYHELQEKLDVAPAKYRQHERFSSFLLAECMHQMAIGAAAQSFSHATTKELREAARKVVEHSTDRPNAVLLALPVAGKDIREELVSALVLYAEHKKIALTPEHPISRLVANVIGSISLGRVAAQYNRAFGVPVVTGTLHNLCPRVQLSDKLHRGIWCSQKFADYNNLHSIEESNVLTCKSMMRYFREYAVRAGKPLYMCEMLKEAAEGLISSAWTYVADPWEVLEEICMLLQAEHTGKDLQRAEALIAQLQQAWEERFRYMKRLPKIQCKASARSDLSQK
ncbi:uncharacterized protein NEMAJ01_2006 [Nematocida major]|uniref:uncharacterized protein n=1 Tax=Nematocida major TaxID=1912982 RepID=UPI002008B213|nr:uncharacterized protein NEMAJ01_2006 [Nematocida major]KAH9387110.1 hypothetical protein NEMAJ01_2006 [Nematocida major]